MSLNSQNNTPPAPISLLNYSNHKNLVPIMRCKSSNNRRCKLVYLYDQISHYHQWFTVGELKENKDKFYRKVVGWFIKNNDENTFPDSNNIQSDVYYS